MAELRARPWHVGLAAVVVGLAAGPRVPVVVLVAAVLVALVASRAALRIGLVVALLTGAIVGQARLQAVDATRLGPRIGHAVTRDVVLLEAPRRRAFGARVATVRLDGERVLLRDKGKRTAGTITAKVRTVAGGREVSTEATKVRLPAGKWRLRLCAGPATKSLRCSLSVRVRSRSRSVRLPAARVVAKTSKQLTVTAAAVDARQRVRAQGRAASV